MLAQFARDLGAGTTLMGSLIAADCVTEVGGAQRSPKTFGLRSSLAAHGTPTNGSVVSKARNAVAASALRSCMPYHLCSAILHASPLVLCGPACLVTSALRSCIPSLVRV